MMAKQIADIKKRNTNFGVTKLEVKAFTIPTASPESDGTIKWDSTSMILVKVFAAGKIGIGYTYADVSICKLISAVLAKEILNANCLDIPRLHHSMYHAVRNLGQSGLVMMALSAVDNALWDLKAKILDLPLCNLFGKAKDKMLLYGSGGFTSYTEKQTNLQFREWAKEGIIHFKMKVGREPDHDEERVRAARTGIGAEAALFVDANGAYSVKQAQHFGEIFSQYDVSWYEEPVRSDNHEGLHFLKEHLPAKINLAAGEYGYGLAYYEKMLSAQTVDVMQADATRCGGLTNFLKIGALCESFQIPFSAHCAPLQHLHAALSLPGFYIAEYFFDHERIEKMFFDNYPVVKDGFMCPDDSRPGLGVDFKYADAKKYLVEETTVTG